MAAFKGTHCILPPNGHEFCGFPADCFHSSLGTNLSGIGLQATRRGAPGEKH
ncbi:MAG: hypothetical protein AAGL24_26730 [Pseudomonadota bacterium]